MTNENNRPQLVVTDAAARQSFITQTEKEEVKSDVNVYPNPAKDVLNILYARQAVLKLYDVSGRLVKQREAQGKILEQIDI